MAPSKGKAKQKTEAVIPLDLKIEDVGCSICLEILVEPITMPCKHRMCKPCFIKNIEITNLHCPFCKKRIGTWARRAKGVNTLIDQKLWEHLKERFPVIVNARLEGQTNDELADESMFAEEFSHRIAKSGQIGEEFKHQIEEMRKEQEELEHKRDLKSKALIMKIQQEELRGKENLPESESPSSSPDLLQPNSFTTPQRLASTSNVISDIEETPALVGPDISFDSNFMELQRQAEERILQAKADEEFARKLQEEESTSVTTKVATRRATPKRSKGPRQLTLEESMRIKRRRID